MSGRRWIAGAALALGACGGGKGPMGPTTTAPQLSCPASIAVRGVTGSTQTVTYPAPVVSGGATPVAVACSQNSGVPFPLGTTLVNCTASDASARQAACSFNVTLTAAALRVTRYETIGDSLTEGENGRLAFLDTPNAYPTKLQALFDATYPGQGITVINRGMSGWPIERTVEELPGDLAADHPGAVLLLSGYNNLLNGCGNGPADTSACRAAMDDVKFGVRDCIKLAKGAGAQFVFVSTMTPPGPVLPGAAHDRRISADAVRQTNDRIRQMTAAEGATLVDVYPLFIGHEADYTDTDGLHLRPAGYQAIADALFASVRATIPVNPLFAGSR